MKKRTKQSVISYYKHWKPSAKLGYSKETNTKTSMTQDTKSPFPIGASELVHVSEAREH